MSSGVLLTLLLSGSERRLGIYGETGFQLLAAHYSLGLVTELKESPVFMNLRGGGLLCRGLAINPFDPGEAEAFNFYGGLVETSAGYEWKFKRGGLRIFAGLSPSYMWVKKYDRWEWETSWAIHLGISSPVITDPVWTKVSGNVYQIGWLDTDFVAHRPAGAFTLMTPLGFGGNLWFFKLGSDTLGHSQENQQGYKP